MTDADAAMWKSMCDLAGRLAESGVASLTLTMGAATRVLSTRTTDLPSELAQAPIGSRLTWDGGALIRDESGWRRSPLPEGGG